MLLHTQLNPVKQVKDVGIEVEKQGQSAACMQTKAGDDSMQQS